MIKVSRLFKRRADIGSAEFTDHWETRYGAAMQGFAQDRGDVRRYAQSRALGEDSPIANAPASPFDGVDEIWCDSVDAAIAFFAAATYRDELRPAERDFVDPAASAVLVGPVRTMWERPAQPEPDALKLMILPVRKAGLSVADFLHHWMNVHSPLALAGPGTRERLQRVEFCPQQGPALGGLALAVFEGSGAIWFDSARQMQEEFGSDHYRDVLQPDETRFSDAARSQGLMLRETRVWARAGGVPVARAPDRGAAIGS